MSVWNKMAFYPTLFYNVMMTKVSSRQWYDRIDDTVLLGALPFRGMTKWFVSKENVKGVVTLNEAWELEQFCNTEQEWQKHGITQLKIPTVDFTASPSEENIEKAISFIFDYREKKASVYVHCKAGRTRSATIVACYLVKLHNWTADEAVSFIKEKRPHVWLRDKQMDSIQQYYEKCNSTDPPPKSGA